MAVVVPAYNEAAWIGDVIATMPAFVDRIIVVDDASEDDTALIARRTGVDVLETATNGGVGRAIARGYQRALELGVDLVAVMAGDGQMDPADLATLAEPVIRERADYAKGNRMVHADVRVMPTMRRLGTYVLSWLTSRATALSIRDSQCGYTVANARALSAVELSRLWPRYGYPNDLLGRLARAGMRVVEVPVRPVYRGAASGLRPRHVLVMTLLIARAAWWRL